MIDVIRVPVEKVKEHDRVECQFDEALSFVVPKIAKYLCGVVPVLPVVNSIHVIGGERQVK